MTYFGPSLDPPLGGYGRKITTLVRDLEYFIHTKFHQNPSSGSGEEVENVNCLTDDGHTTDRRLTTDAGQRVITIGHRSLRLLFPNKTDIGHRIWNIGTHELKDFFLSMNGKVVIWKLSSSRLS